MASYCFLLHFSYITLVIFLAFSLCNGQSPQYAACSLNYSCGEIRNIGYPFWGDNRPSFCGDPNLKLLCRNNSKYPVLNVFQGHAHDFMKFNVCAINMSSHTMVVSQYELLDHCYSDSSNITLSYSTLLKPVGGYSNISLFYNCKNCSVYKTHHNSFSCNKNNIDYVGYNNSFDTAYYFGKNKSCSCSNNFTFVVDTKVLDELKNTDASLLTTFKKNPTINLEYNANFTACSKCEESGGRCGSSENLSEDKFVCYCRDGYHQSLVCPKSGWKKRSLHIVEAVCVPIVVAILLFSSAWFCIYRRKHSKPSSDMEDIAGLESLQFEFKVIKAATDNFSPSNKLGQGGFGVVYKGKLQDEQEIAVKRLSIYSGQGISEFKTEILLAAKLLHNNLAKLLGFSLHGEEKLLIYELMPNASLDKVLFGQNKVSLDWETRYKILLGTARGLLYLHEDSRLKIIHRDLKSSHILLDETMNPKITDFGLARLVGRDQIHADTSKIAGTYGYMAPEYALTGRFSVMSDVYSFGIIALEIISGHTCSSVAFPYHEESLPLRAWNLWKSNSTLDLVDPRLYGKFLAHKMERCIHISLLCIQEDSNKRPTMATIVSALNGHQVALSEPEPPLIGPSTNITFGSHQHLGVSSSGEFLSNSDNITEVYPR